jgi:hypothetical protein
MTIRFSMAVAMLALPLAAQQRANVGEKVPDVTFPAFLNGDGRQMLSEFYGQPVVIDMWGTRCPPCVGTAVPNAIKHDHEHARDGLVTILVESQGSDATQHEAFMWKTFPDNDCFACTGTQIPVPESRGIPYCAIVGVDGTLLWVGNPAGTPQKVEEHVAAELAKMKKGWGDTAEAKRMRAALYGKGDIAAAAAAIATLPDGEPKQSLQAEIDKRYETLKKAIATQKEAGRWMAAQIQAKLLQKAVGTHPKWAPDLLPIVAEFEGDAAKAEIAVEKKFGKVLAQLREKKGDNAPKQLKALLKDGSGKVAERMHRTLAALDAPTKAD